MTAKEAADLRARLGLTQQEFANRLGMSVRAVAGWESAPPHQPSRLASKALEKLARRAGR